MTVDVEALPSPAEEMGRLSDRYVLGVVLGTGATAEVRSGWDRRLDRPVAVKVLRPELAGDPAARRRFSEEARAAARLSHPNVVSVFDTADPFGDGPPYIVMEKLSGDTLRTALECGPLPVAAVRTLAVQMLSALEAGARAGLVHCDIKPGNILATGDGRWKLGDFGIARTIGLPAVDETVLCVAGPEDTAAGLVMGTPAYLSPERLYGQPPTESSDVFSLGVVLYEALTGRRPYLDTSGFPWSTAVTGDPAPPVRDLRPDVDPILGSVVDRSIRLRPEVRFATAREMSAALAAPPVPAPAPTGGGVRLWRLVVGSLAGAATLTASLLLVAAGGQAHPTRAGTVPPGPSVASATTIPPAAAADGAPVQSSATAQAPYNPVDAAATDPAPPTGPGPAHHARATAGKPHPRVAHKKGPMG